MNIVIVVTHLLGAGHLRRALNLAEALLAEAEQNDRVSLISGGLPVGQFASRKTEVWQLPPVKSDGTNFRTLLQPDNRIADSDYMEQRRLSLCKRLNELNADIVITELYPFGRRILREEFISMLNQVTGQAKPTVVLASVRDILAAPSKASRVNEVEEVLEKYYSAVLVHADPSMVELSSSWPTTEAIEAKLLYTGFVAQQPMGSASHRLQANLEASTNNKLEILVSVGSGSVGTHVFETSIQAARQRKDLTWRLLVGGSEAAAEIVRLQQLLESDNVIIEKTRTDYLSLLSTCSCSISMCGYNTAIDLLETGSPGVLIPFDDGGETEQRQRADYLGKLPGFKVVSAGDLNTQSLLLAVEELEAIKDHARPRYQMDGATTSVKLAKKVYREHTRFDATQ